MLEPFQFAFMQRALLAGLLASIACGVIGTYVVVKRIVFISGGISHASVGGLGVAAWLGVPLLYGAVAFSLLSAVVIGVVSLRSREQEDTLIGALWAAGMAIGILFMAQTPGYAADLMSWLLGSILMVSWKDLVLSFVLDAVILLTVWLFYKEFLAVSLDDEFAELRGVPVWAVYLLLLGLVALTVVVMMQVVGIILVIALLTLPPAISRWFVRRLSTMMIASCFLGAFFTVSGNLISFWTNQPSGACIVLIAALVYAVGMGLRSYSS
ncbi:MAG: metal ABC transporter permease [Candidatus Hydrogenedentes bacterium]|nr:metal ABC transporter permease [Candidatus Hydrogenedentota bacterium]